MAHSRWIWFEKTPSGGFKPVAWPGAALMVVLFGFALYVVYRILSRPPPTTSLVLALVLAGGFFFQVVKWTSREARKPR